MYVRKKLICICFTVHAEICKQAEEVVFFTVEICYFVVDLMTILLRNTNSSMHVSLALTTLG